MQNLNIFCILCVLFSGCGYPDGHVTVPENYDEVGEASAGCVEVRLVGVELPRLGALPLHRLTPDHLELGIVQQPYVHKRHQRPVTKATGLKS